MISDCLYDAHVYKWAVPLGMAEWIDGLVLSLGAGSWIHTIVYEAFNKANLGDSGLLPCRLCIAGRAEFASPCDRITMPMRVMYARLVPRDTDDGTAASPKTVEEFLWGKREKEEKA